MRFVRILFVRAAVSDMGFDANQRRAGRFFLGGVNGGSNHLRIIAMLDPAHMPAIGFEAFRDIFGKGQTGRAVNRNRVVIIQADQLVEL